MSKTSLAWLAGLALLLAWCAFDPSTADIVAAYRLTAEVEFEGQTYTGSGVIETRVEHVAWLIRTPLSIIAPHLPEWEYRSARGEAVAVNMGPHGTLFVTLGVNAFVTDSLPLEVFGLWPSRDLPFPDDMRRLVASTETKVIPPKDLPPIVWFPDPARPESAVCSPALRRPPTGDPEGDLPHLPVVRATLRMVREPPTEGVVDRLLPWLAGLKRGIAVLPGRAGCVLEAWYFKSDG